MITRLLGLGMRNPPAKLPRQDLHRTNRAGLRLASAIISARTGYLWLRRPSRISWRVRSGFTSRSRGRLAPPPGLGCTCDVGSGGLGRGWRAWRRRTRGYRFSGSWPVSPGKQVHNQAMHHPQHGQAIAAAARVSSREPRLPLGPDMTRQCPRSDPTNQTTKSRCRQ